MPRFGPRLGVVPLAILLSASAVSAAAADALSASSASSAPHSAASPAPVMQADVAAQGEQASPRNDIKPNDAKPVALKPQESESLSLAHSLSDGIVAEASAGGAGPMNKDSRRMVLKPLISEAALVFGLPHGLVDALVDVESGYNVKAVSRSGAGGLMQLMPGTAKALGAEDRFDPRANLMAGAKYFKSLLDRFQSVPKALAAYKVGPNAIRPNQKHFKGSTQGYIDKVMSIWNSRKDEEAVTAE